jgi:hypothetical protein
VTVDDVNFLAGICRVNRTRAVDFLIALRRAGLNYG